MTIKKKAKKNKDANECHHPSHRVRETNKKKKNSHGNNKWSTIKPCKPSNEVGNIMSGNNGTVVGVSTTTSDDTDKLIRNETNNVTIISVAESQDKVDNVHIDDAPSGLDNETKVRNDRLAIPDALTQNGNDKLQEESTIKEVEVFPVDFVTFKVDPAFIIKHNSAISHQSFTEPVHSCGSSHGSSSLDENSNKARHEQHNEKYEQKSHAQTSLSQRMSGKLRNAAMKVWANVVTKKINENEEYENEWNSEEKTSIDENIDTTCTINTTPPKESMKDPKGKISSQKKTKRRHTYHPIPNGISDKRGSGHMISKRKRIASLVMKTSKASKVGKENQKCTPVSSSDHPQSSRPSSSILRSRRNSSAGPTLRSRRNTSSGPSLHSVIGLMMFRQTYLSRIDKQIRRGSKVSDIGIIKEEDPLETTLPASDRFCTFLSSEAKVSMLYGYDDAICSKMEPQNTDESMNNETNDNNENSKRPRHERGRDVVNNFTPKIQGAMDLLDSLKSQSGEMVTSTRHQKVVVNAIEQYSRWKQAWTKDSTCCRLNKS